MTMSETKFTFTWHIENYFLCGLENGKCIESSDFVDCVYRNRWTLQLYPRGSGENGKGYCSVFLKRCSNDEDTTIDFKIEIVDKNNHIVKSNESLKHTFTIASRNWGWPQFVRIDDCIKSFDSDDIFTVRCQIITDEPFKGQWATSCVSRTRIGVNTFSDHWHAENSNQPDGWSESKSFPFLESSSVEISWKFTSDVLQLRLKKLNDDNNARFAQCELTLLDKRNQKFSSQKESFLFTSKNNCWEFNSFITKSLLKVNESTLLQNKGTAVKCEFTISNGDDSNVIEYIYSNSWDLSSSSSAGDSDSVPPSLSDFKELFVKKKFADIELHVGTEVIPAHKCILAARSPVFSAMFENDMTENHSGVVEINDIDAETLSDLMEFLYTGKADMKNGTALKLLVAADKYQVSTTLKVKCLEFLKSILSLDNVLETVIAADLVGCADLKNAAIDYIKSNSCSVLVMEKWFDLVRDNVQLGREIIRSLQSC